MLHFILGRCGNGKSAKLREILSCKIKSGSEKIILIVPEQSSFGNEKRMLDTLGNKNFNKIKVLSFSRLFDFISQILKIPPIAETSDMTQVAMMNAAIENVKRNLRLYAKNPGNIEVAELMLGTFKEFKSNKIDDAILSNIERLSNKDILKQKISEIKLIINSYKSITENKFADSFDNLDLLEKIIRANNVFEDYSIFFDEFSDFTPQQLSILEAILIQAKNVYMAFCCDKDTDSVDEKDLFSCVVQTINRVKNLARKHSLEIAPSLLLEKTLRFRNSELEMLEKNIFGSVKTSLDHIPENIQIYSALNQDDECEHIARTIQKFIIEKNYSYRDFAILSRDIENYSGTFKSVFKRYGIPYFLDAPEKIFNKNIINFIFAAFDSVNSPYEPDSILRYLKSGLTDLSMENIAAIENYILLWDIKGNSWNSDFIMHPEGFSKDFEKTHILELEKLNELRKLIITPIERFKKKISGATGKEISEAVYDLLTEAHVPENLRSFCKKLLKKGEKTVAEQEARLWDVAMDILSEMANAFEHIKISSKKYSDILNSVVNSVNLSSIPQSIDNVVVGSVNRIRLSDPKIVFIAGAINGEFPKVPDNSEIFTDLEINHISSLGIQLTDNIKNFLIKERFLAYVAIANASQKIFISWPSSNGSGSGKLPSEIIKEVKNIFPRIKILNRDSFSEEDSVWCEKPAFEICARNWEISSEFAAQLKNYFIKSKDYEAKCIALKNLSDENTLNFKNSQNSQEFFGGNIKLSASQIEKYYTCPFGYFCEYALKAKPQKPARFGALEYGNLMHFSLEKLFKKYPQNEIINITKQTLENEINSIIENYITDKLGGKENKPERFIYIIERFKNSINFLVDHFIEEFRQSSFTLSDLELEISKTGDIPPLTFLLPNGGKITIDGKIDRVDVMKCENGNYIRIIDYKTGAKDFMLSDVFYGLNMQMLIYLLAILKNGNRKYGHIIPAGVLYFTALKPTIYAENKKNTFKTEEQVKKKLRMNGIVLDNISVISGMDKEGKGTFIPVEIKNGEIKKSQSLTNLTELSVINHHIESLIKKMAKCLKDGCVDAKPICKKNNTACKWCDYFPVCCYEKEKFIEIPTNVSNKKALEEMSKEGEKDNE